MKFFNELNEEIFLTDDVILSDEYQVNFLKSVRRVEISTYQELYLLKIIAIKNSLGIFNTIYDIGNWKYDGNSFTMIVDTNTYEVYVERHLCDVTYVNAENEAEAIKFAKNKFMKKVSQMNIETHARILRKM